MQEPPDNAIELRKVAIEQQKLHLEGTRTHVEEEKLKLEERKVEAEEKRPFFEAAIKFGELAIKSLLILNGATAAGLISFSGTMAASGKIASVGELKFAIAAFAIGAALAVLTAGLAYLAQFEYGMVKFGVRQTNDRGDYFRALTVGAGAASWLAFLIGVAGISVTLRV